MFPAPHLLSQAPSAPLQGNSSFILTPPADLHLLSPHVLPPPHPLQQHFLLSPFNVCLPSPRMKCLVFPKGGMFFTIFAVTSSFPSALPGSNSPSRSSAGCFSPLAHCDLLPLLPPSYGQNSRPLLPPAAPLLLAVWGYP